jgi:exodeoxyribonuclease III
LPLRLTTWNVNSIRLRLDTLARVVEHLRPDVLCLQETKCSDEHFPQDAVRALGFPHVAIHGQPGYHGVAVLSKVPLGAPATHRWCGIDHARHMAVTLPGDILLHNIYVPAGGDVPDREQNPKFAHKLDFLAELAVWLREGCDSSARAVIAGDLNVAPLETDVWSHKQLLKVGSHTPVEVEALGRLQDSCAWIDAVRRIVPPEEKLFTWWSYRAQDWSASDRGRRLDHVWLSPALAPALLSASVLREARGWPNPSDHVPVTVELTL